MIRLLPLPSSSSLLFDKTIDLHLRPKPSLMICSFSRTQNLPKLEPFSRSKIDRCIKEPDFLEKSVNQLADYCSTLEGESSYNCWSAYFELKHLEEKLPKEDVVKLIRGAQGLKSLIDCVHAVSATHSGKDTHMVGSFKAASSSGTGEKVHGHVPDGIPKTKEELEEEEEARMPDSPYTRLLRSKGKSPAWYSSLPDHETD